MLSVKMIEHLHIQACVHTKQTCFKKKLTVFEVTEMYFALCIICNPTDPNKNLSFNAKL